MLHSLAVKLIAGAAIIALVFGYAYFAGRNADEVKELKDTVKAHETRDEVKRRVEALSDYELCVELGRLPDDCAQLRGLDKAAKGK
ncbi:MAG: hypothetical protein ACRCU5_13800 [Rhizobiaceae bacterium]